jgi:hypothetical protein
MKIVYEKNQDKIVFDKKYKFFLKNSLLNSYFHNVYSDINDVVLLEDVIDTFTHKNSELLMSSMVNLILYLEEQKHTLCTISISDIVVVDKIHFVFMNSTNVVPIVNDYISINAPVEKNDFLSPELKQLKSIPSKIYFTSCYYSLSTVVFYALFKINYTTDTSELKKVYYSKLYFFLLRCLNPDPKKRKLIFI